MGMHAHGRHSGFGAQTTVYSSCGYVWSMTLGALIILWGRLGLHASITLVLRRALN